MLEIRNLHVELEDGAKPILKGLDLSVGAGQVHAIMGPNGSGKSTLSYVLAGRDGYAVTQGSAHLGDTDLLALEPEERASAGLFLAFQYPVEIPGVGNMTFLRTALNSQRKARGEDEVSAADFLKRVRAKASSLKIDADMLKRPINVGFSGGEKKRNEILQMAVLEPRMCILDETDSGLDVDAMRLVSEGVNALRSEGRIGDFGVDAPEAQVRAFLADRLGAQPEVGDGEFACPAGHLLEWARLLLHLDASQPDPAPWLVADARARKLLKGRA